MKVRWRLIPTGAVVGLVTLSSGLLAGAAPVRPPVRPPVATVVPSSAAPSAPAELRLITGERVRVDTTAGRPVAVVTPVGGGIRRAVTVYSSGGRMTVVPAIAKPYLGRLLDPDLFDLATLRASTKDGRLAVRIRYTGAAPSIAGVRLTSAAGGEATGYITARSAVAFGESLAARWAADRGGRTASRTDLFGGVTSIRAAARVAPVGVRTRSVASVSLTIKVIGSDGLPAVSDTIQLGNVDDGSRYYAPVEVVNGVGTVDVEPGHYSFFGVQTTHETADRVVDRVAAVDQVNVTRAGQVVTVDYRNATTRPTVVTPSPTVADLSFLYLERTAAIGGLATSVQSSNNDVLVTPVPKPTIGSLRVTQEWKRNALGDRPAIYNLTAETDRIPARWVSTFTTADLGTVNSVYYGDGGATVAGFTRYSAWQGAYTLMELIPRPSTRTEYVGSLGTPAPAWVDVAEINLDDNGGLGYPEDTGFITGPTRTIAAGSVQTVRWFRGPLAPSVPKQTGTYRFCYACRTGDDLDLHVSGFLDSTSTHNGYVLDGVDGIPHDGIPNTRFRLYRDDALVADQDFSNHPAIRVPASAARYRAVFDVNRRLQAPVLSTQTQTEYGFTSSAGAGPRVPTDWWCNGRQGDTACRFLPLVHARVTLDTDLYGRLPAAPSDVVVNVARVQGAAPSAAAGATLEVRAAGTARWFPSTLTARTAGRYEGIVDNSRFAGRFVDLRVTGTDQAGSTFRQTTLRAYRVAG